MLRKARCFPILGGHEIAGIVGKSVPSKNDSKLGGPCCCSQPNPLWRMLLAVRYDNQCLYSEAPAEEGEAFGLWLQ